MRYSEEFTVRIHTRGSRFPEETRQKYYTKGCQLCALKGQMAY